MNILKKLNKAEDIYNFSFYGLNDYATNFDVQEIIDNVDQIKDYYNHKSKEISNRDDFIDYLYLNKFNQFNDLEKYIDEKYKQKYSDIIKFLKTEFDQYDSQNLIQYIKSEGISLLNEDKYYLNINIFEISFKYHNALKEIIEFIIKNKFYMILHNFNEIKNVILKYEDLSLEILKVSNFEYAKWSALKDYFKILKFFINKKKYNNEIDENIKVIVSYGNKVYEEINEDNYLQYNLIYNEIVNFLREINHKSYIPFEQKLKKINKVKDDYIKKHGHEFSIELPIQKLLEYFKNDKISIFNKMIMLTHTKNDNSPQLISYFTYIANMKSQSLTDILCSTTTPHDDYFTISKQHTLNLFDYTYLSCLQYYICKDRINQFISYLGNSIKEICYSFKLDYEELELETDFNILLNMFMELFRVIQSENDFLMYGMYYSISMFEMALIEKILRNLYISISEESFINSKWASLGTLLSADNKEMSNLLGSDNVKYYSYYLIKYKNQIGFNYRNKFAHYKDMQVKDMNFGTLLKISQIMLCIINELNLNKE